MGFMPTDLPPPGRDQPHPVAQGEALLQAALRRLEEVMDRDDISPGSVATVACSYANVMAALAERTGPERAAPDVPAPVGGGDLRDMEASDRPIAVEMLAAWIAEVMGRFPGSGHLLARELAEIREVHVGYHRGLLRDALEAAGVEAEADG